MPHGGIEGEGDKGSPHQSGPAASDHIGVYPDAEKSVPKTYWSKIRYMSTVHHQHNRIVGLYCSSTGEADVD